MKNLISIGAVALIFASGAFGSFGVTVDVGSLQDEGGAALVEKGMLYLVSGGVDGVFSLPEAGGIIGAGSDDAIVESWDLTSEVSAGGEYIIGSGAVSYTGLAEGQSLAILWFPNLTQANQTPADGEAYGFYRSTDGGGGDSWTIPVDGTLLHSLKFFAGGSNPLVDDSDIPSFLAAAAFAAGQDAVEPVINLAGLSTGEPDPGTVTFGWSGSTAPGGGFRIERRLQSGGDWSILGMVGGDVDSFDDPNIGRGKNYDYRLVAINGFGTEMTEAQRIETLRSNLGNLATRGVLGSGENVLIVGFVTEGTGTIDLLTRTQGPELNSALPGRVAIDPKSTLLKERWELVDGVPTVFNDVIQMNDDWAENPDQLIEIRDLFDRTIAVANSDEASKDSAMSLQLDGTNLYTIISEDLGSTEPRLAIVEVFDGWEGAPNASGNRLTNLATRGYVGTGDDVLIGGFYVNGAVNSRLLLRGIGPDLAARGVSAPLQNPKITLSQTVWELVDNVPTPKNVFIDANDNWEDLDGETIAAVSIELGADPLDPGSKDAAMLVTLDPGLYTFILEGVDAGEGVGLLEVFLAD